MMKMLLLILSALPHCPSFYLAPCSMKNLHLKVEMESKKSSDFSLSSIRRVPVGTTACTYLQPPQWQRPLFFERAAETAVLTSQLYGKPIFSVVVGPPSCGKSILINHVLDQKLNDGRNAFHVIRIDLRGRVVSGEDSLYSVLMQKSVLAASADKAWSAFTGILRSLKTFDLDRLIPTIPEWPLGGDGRPFVLFIDEATELSILAAKDREVCMYMP